jgi:protein SCO1/2
MQNKPPRPSWQIGALFFVGLGAVLAGSLYARHLKDAASVASRAVPATQAAAVYQMPRPMPEFALTDDDGHPAGPGVFRGGWSLLFFGYTHCPDGC